MGLSGGPNGAKAVFRERFGRAFVTTQSLKEVRELTELPRESALAVLDGNVMMSAVPTSVDTFGGYVAVLSHQIRAANEAAAHVVVVFDEPQAMTIAKREEQQRRDTQRKPLEPVCSDDLVAGITNDDFTTEMLHSEGFNAKILMGHRSARSRFFDAICVALLRQFVVRGAHKSGSLTFDGIDARGAERELGARRDAGVFSSHQSFWGELLAREAPIGEGDLKLTDVTQRVHDAAQRAESLVAGVVLNLVVTIDTDSFAIELLQQNRRTRRTADDEEDERTIICFKERSLKRKGDDFVTAGHYLCCDVHVLHEAVLEYFYGTRSLSKEIEAQQPAAMALLAAALACCGCDFVKIDGMRVDLVLPIVRDIVRNHRDELMMMQHVLSGDHDWVVRRAVPTIKFLISEFADAIINMPRMQRAHASVKGHCSAQVLRALWTCSYWHQKEFKNCIDWGFAAASG